MMSPMAGALFVFALGCLMASMAALIGFALTSWGREHFEKLWQGFVGVLCGCLILLVLAAVFEWGAVVRHRAEEQRYYHDYEDASR